MALVARQIACNGCGAKVDIHTGLRMKTFVCDYCGSVCDGQQVLAVQEREAARQKYMPWSHLRLGMECKLLGQDYQIVGRIRVAEKTWWWDEWFLMSKTGFPLYLQEDEGRYSIFRVFYPTLPVDPRTCGSFIKLDKKGGNVIVKERGHARIAYIEGELTWRAVPGEEFDYMDARRGQERYSIEWDEDEFQFLSGKGRNPNTIYKWFGITDPVPKPPSFDDDDEDDDEEEWREPEKAAKKKKKKSVLGSILVAVAFLAGLGVVLLGLVSAGFFLGDGFATKVAAYTFNVRAATGKAFEKDDKGQFVRDKKGKRVLDHNGVILTDEKGKPLAVKLPKSRGAYEIRLGSSTLPSPGWRGQTCYWAEVTLLKARKGADPTDDEEERYIPVHTFKASFWRERGIDEGESYDETDRVASHYFRTSDRGPYYVKVVADNCVGSAGNAVKQAKLTVAIFKDVWMSRWLLIAGCALMGIVILGKMSWWSD
jgi:hypothetical protein